MAFLTKPSFIKKKIPLIRAKSNEATVEAAESANERRRLRRLQARLSITICLAVLVLVVVLLGIATGLVLYREYIRAITRHRYQGYCTIASNEAEALESSLPAQVRWSTSPDAASVPDSADDVVQALFEQLQIEDTIEKISIMDNGRNVDFIHDFDANLTGIVDVNRCFFMELDPSTVLAPEVFVLHIEGGNQFDVSHVTSSLRAVLPAVKDSSFSMRALTVKCVDKPTYRLLKDEGLIIRKRAVDAPPHDFIQFAGRHVQEIQISNLGEVLQHEQAVQGQ